MQVLLIEDSPDDIFLFQDRVKPDTEVIVATTLASGVRKVIETSPDIVVLDLHLPDSRGVQTYADFSSQTADLPPIPVIIYTGNDDPELSMECIRMGAAAFIGKSQLADSKLQEVIELAVDINNLRIKQAEPEPEMTAITLIKSLTDKFKALVSEIKGNPGER